MTNPFIITLLYLPTLLWNWVIYWIVPFNKNKYTPSTKSDRLVSQASRNTVRLTDYHIKRALLGRTNK